MKISTLRLVDKRKYSPRICILKDKKSEEMIMCYSPYKARMNKGILIVKELRLRKANISFGEEQREMNININN